MLKRFALFAGCLVWAGFAAVAAEPMLSYRPGKTGVYDIWLKWTFADGKQDARIEVAHMGGVTGVAVHFPGKIGSGGIYRGDMAGKPLCDYRSGFTFSAWMRILTPPEGDTVQQFWVKQELRSQGDLANGYYM